MSSYQLFAWRDAMALASWLERDYDVKRVRKVFEAQTPEYCIKFEYDNRRHIEELIRRSESQRPAYVRKVCRNVDEVVQGVFIVFAIIAQVRTRNLLELRDRYQFALTPGGGNRITCSELYAFHLDAMRLHAFVWPDEVFRAYGGDGGWPDDDEEDDKTED
jgi:hypothetical protein